MGDLTSYFSRVEFECRCGCGADTVDYELMEGLMMLRRYLSRAIRIHSAMRCPNHNHSVGSNSRSQHLLGKAADFSVDTVEPAEIADYLESLYPDRHGIGRYATFTHFDVRKNLARWNNILTLT